MEHKVGQILYTVIAEKQLIVPVKIIEQITIKNLDSETTVYKVLLPNKKNQKVRLDKFEKVFDDIDKLNDHLLSNAKQSIEKMLESAIELEELFFNEKKENSLDENIACNIDNNNITIKNQDNNKIILEDGTVANIINNIEKEPINAEKNLTTWWL